IRSRLREPRDGGYRNTEELAQGQGSSDRRARHPDHDDRIAGRSGGTHSESHQSSATRPRVLEHRLRNEKLTAPRRQDEAEGAGRRREDGPEGTVVAGFSPRFERGLKPATTGGTLFGRPPSTGRD